MDTVAPGLGVVQWTDIMLISKYIHPSLDQKIVYRRYDMLFARDTG